MLAQADVALKSGRPDDAIALCRQWLAETPEDMEAQAMLGASLAAKGSFEEAAAVFAKLVRANPGHLQMTVLLARAKAALGDSEEAASLLKGLVPRAASDPRALKEIAETLVLIGSAADALPVFESLERLVPNDAQIVFGRAHALQLAKRNEEALAGYRRGLTLLPNVSHARAKIGAIQMDAGRYEEARTQYQLAITHGRDRSAGLQFARAGLTPVIFDSNEQIDAVRSRIKSEFESLRLGRIRLRDPAAEVGITNSYNTYHGRPNRGLQEVIARTYASACPDLLWISPTLTARRPEGEPIRLGLCSAFMWEHAIGRVMLGLLQRLDRRQFDVTLFRVGRASDALGHKLDEAAGRSVVLASHIETARRTLAEASLDILLYSDFGAEPLTSFLCYSRLAPVQVVAWGFPDTSGVANLDYYASTAAFEPPNAQAHYSEVLIAPPRLYSYMFPPETPLERCTKQEMGFDEDARLYVCAQSLFKVHPDFDAAISGILRRDPKGYVVFFEGPEPHWKELLHHRFARTMPDCADRVRILPRLGSGKFQGALNLADAVIDTKHFTGGYTTYMSFFNHVPVVTWNGELMRGRMTRGLYTLMGMDPLSADTDDEFVELAIRTATDRRFKQDIQAQLKDHSARLFRDEGAVRDFERFLVAAHRSAMSGDKLSGWSDVDHT